MSLVYVIRALFGTAAHFRTSATTKCWGCMNFFTEMCSGSEAGSYARPMDFVYHSTLGSRVIKKKKEDSPTGCPPLCKGSWCSVLLELVRKWPLSSKFGTYQTVRTRLWPWLAGASPSTRCFLFDRKLLWYCRPGSGCRLAQCVISMVVDGQLPHKIVNILFISSLCDKLTMLWGS